MAEYLDKSTVLELLDTYDKAVELKPASDAFEHALNKLAHGVVSHLRMVIKVLPAADVVPVVRCKFCKHSRPYIDLKVECDVAHYTSHYFMCDYGAPDRVVLGDGYCQAGELKSKERAWKYDWEDYHG